MNDQIKFKEIDGFGLNFARLVQDFILIIFECRPCSRIFFDIIYQIEIRVENVNVSINLIYTTTMIFPYRFLYDTMI